MGITCDEAREILWPLERPRPSGPREEKARQHLAGCDPCQRFFELDVVLDRALRAASAPVPAPAELRERIYDALARERTLRPSDPVRDRAAHAEGGWARRLRGWRYVTAVAVLALASAIFWLRSSGPAPFPGADEYVDDFMRVAALDLALPDALDTATVARFYMRQLGRRIAPVSLDQARLTRALICQLDGKRGAMIEYEMDGTRLAHYRIPLEQPGERTASEVDVSSEMGVQVARWRDGVYEHALVSEMPERSLEDLALAHFVER